MGVIKKEGIKQSVIIYIGVFIGTINTLYIYPKFFDPDHLGLFRFLMDTSILLFPFISLGVHNLSVRMFPTFKSDKNGHNGLLFLLMTGVTFGFLLFLAIVYFMEPQIVLYLKDESLLIQQYWYFIIPLAGFTIFTAIGSQYLLNFKKVVLPSIFNDLYLKIGMPIIGILIYYDYLNIREGVYSLVAIYFLKLFSFALYTIWIKEWHWKPNWEILKPPLLKEMRIYSLYGILGSIGSVIATRIDVIMVALLADDDLKDVAVYTIAMFVANIITVPASALTNIASPVIADAWKRNDVKNIKEIYSKSSIVLLTIGLFFFIGIWCSVDDLFALMPKGEIYSQGKYVILILGLGKLFDLATGANDQIISYSKYFRFNFYAVLVLAILNVINNVIFIPIYQINGAALATASSVLIYNLSKSVYIYYKIGIQPFTLNTLKVLIIGGLVYLLAINIASTNTPFLNIIIRSIFIGITFLGSIIYFKISDDLTSLFWQTLDKVKAFIK